MNEGLVGLGLTANFILWAALLSMSMQNYDNIHDLQNQFDDLKNNTAKEEVAKAANIAKNEEGIKANMETTAKNVNDIKKYATNIKKQATDIVKNGAVIVANLAKLECMKTCIGACKDNGECVQCLLDGFCGKHDDRKKNKCTVDNICQCTYPASYPMREGGNFQCVAAGSFGKWKYRVCSASGLCGGCTTDAECHEQYGNWNQDFCSGDGAAPSFEIGECGYECETDTHCIGSLNGPKCINNACKPP